jgi:hypothetical protein
LSGGKEAFRSNVIRWRLCPLWYLFIEYHIVNGILLGGAHPMIKVMMLLRRVPRHSGVGRRDGFPTQVHGVRGTWVSTAISHRDQCLRSTLPETRGG